MRTVTSGLQPEFEPPPDETCAICGATIPGRGSYCPRCGAVKPSKRYSGLPPAGNRRAWTAFPSYQTPVPRVGWRKIVKAISAFIMLTFAVQMVLSIVALVYGVQIVTPAILHDWSGFGLFLIFPEIIVFATLSGYYLLAFYFFLIGAIVASCTWVFMTSIDGFSKELSMRAPSRQHSALFETFGLLFATLFFSVIVALILTPSGNEVPSTGTLAESLFTLANASVWEELIVRVLLIGLPMIFVDLARRERQAKLYSYVLGGGFKIRIPEAVLVLASSALFGYAHYAAGWGAWKIVPAAVGGMAFGYLFLKFGLAASIMLHFATDYLSMPMEVFNSTGLTIITGLAIIVWLGLGLVFFIYYITRIGEFLAGKKLLEPQPVYVAVPMPSPWVQVPVYTPPDTYHQMGQQPYMQQSQPPQNPVTPGPFGGYVCPVCGYTQARWMNGRFQCLRCGNLS